LIAHRLSTIKDCDKIIVLKNGVLVEEGPHDELYAQGGMYTMLWDKQNELIQKEEKEKEEKIKEEIERKQTLQIRKDKRLTMLLKGK
jgi:ABC-type multidrug transport system ATPase subunit